MGPMLCVWAAALSFPNSERYPNTNKEARYHASFGDGRAAWWCLLYPLPVHPLQESLSGLTSQPPFCIMHGYVFCPMHCLSFVSVYHCLVNTEDFESLKVLVRCHLILSKSTRTRSEMFFFLFVLSV